MDDDDVPVPQHQQQQQQFLQRLQQQQHLRQQQQDNEAAALAARVYSPIVARSLQRNLVAVEIPVSLGFLIIHHNCLRVSPDTFHTWLMTQDVVTMEDLKEACGNPEFVLKDMVPDGGLKRFKRFQFIQAVQQYQTRNPIPASSHSATTQTNQGVIDLTSPSTDQQQQQQTQQTCHATVVPSSSVAVTAEDDQPNTHHTAPVPAAAAAATTTTAAAAAATTVNTTNTTTTTTTTTSITIRKSNQKRDDDQEEEDEEIQILSSTTTNANILYPHKRQDCGLHPFSGDIDNDTTLRYKFCDKCYCIVCNIPAKDCTEWKDHCQRVYEPTNGDDSFDDEILLESPDVTAQNFYAAATAALAVYRSRQQPRRNNAIRRNIVVPKLCKVKEIVYKAPHTFKPLANAAKKLFEEVIVNDTATSTISNENNECIICHSCLLSGGINNNGKAIDVGPSEHKVACQKIKKWYRPVRLPCGHVFHRKCILDHIKSGSGNTCPHSMCDKLLGEPQGKSPSGTMTIYKNKTIHCSGYDNGHDANSEVISLGTIILEYHIPKTMQMKYHENPNIFQSGAVRTCYIPDIGVRSDEMLSRLEYAFTHGLIFTVDTSNNVSWTSIPYKTSATDDFITNNFFELCDEQLDKLHVPSAQKIVSSKNGSNNKLDNNKLSSNDSNNESETRESEIQLPWKMDKLNNNNKSETHENKIELPWENKLDIPPKTGSLLSSNNEASNIKSDNNKPASTGINKTSENHENELRLPWGGLSSSVRDQRQIDCDDELDKVDTSKAEELSNNGSDNTLDNNEPSTNNSERKSETHKHKVCLPWENNEGISDSIEDQGHMDWFGRWSM